MANPENLVRNEDRTPEQLRENGRKGGIAQGRNKRKRKMLRDLLLEELASKNPGTKMSKAEYITARVIKKLADDPNMHDLRIVYELVGELEQRVTVGAADTEKPIIVFKGRETPADGPEGEK